MRLLGNVLVVLAVLAACGFVAWQGLELLRTPEPWPARRPGEAPETDADAPVPRPAFGAGSSVAAGGGAVGGRVDWTAENQECLAALERGALDEAIACFEACLAGDPDEPVYARNLAEALARKAYDLYERDPLAAEDAVALLERALELNPARDGLAKLLDRWRRSADAEEGFFTQRTLHFLVSYDLDRAEVRREIQTLCDLLETAYMEFGENFDFRPADGDRPPIRVVIYSRDAFDSVTGLGAWAGGVYDGTIRVPVADLARELSRVRRVLRHELLHAFVQEAGGSTVPGWLNEGLAQWLEDPQPSARAHAVAVARQKLAGRELFPLERLSGSLASWADPDEIELAYAQALAFVGYLDSMVRDRVLYEMVTGCARGVPAAETFREAEMVGLDTVFEDLQRELEEL